MRKNDETIEENKLTSMINFFYENSVYTGNLCVQTNMNLPGLPFQSSYSFLNC